MANAKPAPITRVVRFRVDEKALTPAQQESLSRHAGCARQAWNWATGRWHTWQENLAWYVDRLAAHDAPTHGVRPDELKADASWTKQAWQQTREVHGQNYQFENAVRLQELYRLEAEHQDSRLHWWVAEGSRSGLPKHQQHGVSTFAYQQALDDFAKTVREYYRRPRYSKRTGRRQGAPRFKRHDDEQQGFCIQSLAPNGTDPWRIISGGHRVVVPKIGSIRLVQNTRRLRRFIAKDGKPTSARFTRRGGKWHVSINVQFTPDNPYVMSPAHPTRPQRDGGTVGVDLGVNHLATLSDGTQVPNRRFLVRSQQELARLMRRRDRQHRAGSPDCFHPDGTHKKDRCRWEDKSRAAQTTQAQITRLHDLLARRRAGYLHEVTKHLATSYAKIGIEDLSVSGMTASAKPNEDSDQPGHYLPNRRKAKAGLNRAILDAGFFEFRRQLDYKTSRYGSVLHVAGRYAATSKTCSACGWEKPNLTLADRTFECDHCGLVLDRDHNAALNIRALACGGAAPMERERPVPVGAAVNDTRAPGAWPSSAEKTRHRGESTGPARDPSPPSQVHAGALRST